MSKLYIVPTPIGNLKDITQRALEILKEVGFVLAEDTRNAGHLLKQYNIKTDLVSFHQHNEHKMLEKIIEKLKNNTAALISDAGTPGISDPGFLLVRACVEAGICVETLPGATAFVPALVNSGFPCDKFYFHGFLPHKKGRIKELEYIRQLGITTVLYESPYRIIKTLEQMTEVFGGEHRISISREISKLFEETIRGTINEIIEIFSQKSIKGEFVIVISGVK